jgi:siderophore synthetase component
LPRHADRLGVRDSLGYVRATKAIDPAFSPLAFFEQWVVEGHPLHPCARMKMGMDAEDVIRNAPEWGAAPGVALVAVAKSACRAFVRGPEGAADVLAREHPTAARMVAEALRRQGKALADYELIPVHPWQLEHTLPTLHAGPIHRGEVVPIPGCVIPARALMSVRSMAPVQRVGEGTHHIKTAIDVHMTSAVRTVSPNAAENGPKLSRMLSEILAREGDRCRDLVTLSEDVGIHFEPREPGLDAETAAAQRKHLAAMLRDDPEANVALDEVAMPAAALTSRSPQTSGLIVEELIDDYAALSGLVDRRRVAVAFLRRYAEVSVPGFLTLMTRYGVALEGHMQNSVAVFRHGEPTRMLVRDLGAVRILPGRLEWQGIELTIVPGSAILADDLDDLRNKVYYSFFQNHLAELIAAIVRSFDVEERALWDEIARAARRVFRELMAVDGLAEQAADDERALFRPTLALKALTTMRLKGEVTDYTFADVPNPLAARHPARTGGDRP